MIKVAINGFGRIGRLVFRIMANDPEFDIVAINDLTDAEQLAYLLKYDTNHRNYNVDGINFVDNNIVVDGKKIPVYSSMDPSVLPWGELGVDVVFECSGKFTDKDKAYLHIKAGAKKVIISKEETMIIDAKNQKSELMQSRLELIRELMNKAPNDYDKEKYQTRLNRLNGGIAILKVGGASETEVDELKDRIDDAICATKAALSEGIVVGGGTAALYASKSLDELTPKNNEQLTGINIVKTALRAPIKVMCNNAGMSGELICNQLLEENNQRMGIDLNTGKKVDMIKAGVVDPVKVVRSAVVSAVKIAGVMITTEAAVVDDGKDNDKKKKGNKNEQMEDE